MCPFYNLLNVCHALNKPIYYEFSYSMESGRTCSSMKITGCLFSLSIFIVFVAFIIKGRQLIYANYNLKSYIQKTVLKDITSNHALPAWLASWGRGEGRGAWFVVSMVLPLTILYLSAQTCFIILSISYLFL